jgi:ABC-type amino acid transport substrate-binding protein
MRSKLLLIFALCFFALSAISIAQETSTDVPKNIIETLQSHRLVNYLPDLAGREIKIAVENEYPPFNSINSDGIGEGWDYDAIKEICVRLNCEPHFNEVSWTDLIPSVSNGTFDVGANGITRLPARYELVDFSMPFVTLRQVLIIRRNDERFTTLEGLVASDAKIWAPEGTTNYDLAVALVGENRAEATRLEVDAIINQVVSGEIDAFIFDSVSAHKFLLENSDILTTFPESISDIEELAFVFPNDSDLTSAFTIAIETMRLDGTLLELNDKWFTGE